MSWQSRTLGEVVSEFGGLIQTGPFGSQLKQAEYTDTGIPVVMPKDISNGEIDIATVARITEAKADQLKRHKVSPRTIVLPRRGEITKRAFVREEQTGWICGTGCLKIEPPEQVLHPKFLYYFMGTFASVDWLEKNAVGATMLNLSAEILGRFPLRFPDLPTQERIAGVLSAYDDLIENNRRRIALLEQAARLLYREWFVHFRFPGYETAHFIDGLPEGWRKCAVDQLLVLQRGFDLPVSKRKEGSVPIYGSTGIVGYHNQPKVVAPVITTGRSGSLGQVSYSHEDCWPLNTALWVKEMKDVPPLYVFFFLQNLDLKEFGGGASVPTLDRKVVHRLDAVRPAPEILEQFENAVGPMFQQVKNFEVQNDKLAKARDLLLPRLMDGRLPIPE